MAQLPKGGLGYGDMINQYMGDALSTFQVVYIYSLLQKMTAGDNRSTSKFV